METLLVNCPLATACGRAGYCDPNIVEYDGLFSFSKGVINGNEGLVNDGYQPFTDW